MVKSPPWWNLHSRQRNTRQTMELMEHTVLGSGNWEGNTDRAYGRWGRGRGKWQHDAGVGQPSRASLKVSTEEGLGRMWGEDNRHLWEKCSRQRLHWQLRYGTHNLHGPCSCDGNPSTNPCLARWACRVCQCKGLGWMGFLRLEQTRWT